MEFPVVEVTLLEDRAAVVRRGSVTLAAGRHTLRLEGVAPVLADKTCTAAFVGGAPGAAIDDLRVRRTWVSPEDRSGAVAALEAELTALHERRERLSADQERVAARGARHDDLLQRTLTELAEDAGWGRTPAAEWREALDGELTGARGLSEAGLDAEWALADCDEAIERVSSRLQALQGWNLARRAWIELDVTVPAAGAYALRCDYVVPGACWRPRHVARLDESAGAARVHWSCEGSAWQHTGEDWTDVTLRFSTQRLSLGAEPPRLATDELSVQPKAAELTVEAREEQVQTTGLGRAGGRQAVEVPGVDDGGRALTLTAPVRATIPSDGRPYRVPLFEFEAEAEVSRVASPELLPAVLWKSAQANAAPHPLLAGPVDLIRRHGLVGRATVLFVAPGERFELGWGPDAELRLRREQHQHDAERGMLSAWTSREEHVTVRCSNLADAPARFTLTERVPVSEIEKVQIAVDAKKTSDGAASDADGFVRWTVELAPFGTKQIELLYTVKHHKDVVFA